MIREIVIGSRTVDTTWALAQINNEKNDKFIKYQMVCDGLYQKVAIDTAIKCDGITASTQQTSENIKVSSYELSPYVDTEIGINFNTFRPKIRKCSDKFVSELWCVTINSHEYRLISFISSDRIVGTHRRKGEYQGCSLIVPCAKLKADTESRKEHFALSMILKHLDTGKIMKMSLIYDKETGNFVSKEKEIVTPKSVKKFTDILNKQGEHEFTFKLNMMTKVPTTKAVICKEECLDTFTNKINEMIGDNKPSFTVVSLPNEFFDDKFIKADATEKVKKIFEDIGNPRATTFVGFKLPVAVTKSLKLNYIFGFDPTTGEIFNIKS